MNLRSISISIALAGLLAACSMEPEQEACKPRGKNLLKDPKFATVFGSAAKRKWSASEHRAGRSFEHEVNDGELLIRKTGREPWFIMSQMVPAETIKGKTVLFSAQIKLDLQEPEPEHNFKVGSGLSLTAMVNGKPALRSIFEHEPHMGTHDWQTVQVKADMPKNLGILRVGFLHQTNGEISVRSPSLRLLPNSECAL